MQYILNIFILLFVISSKKKFFFFSQINNFQIPNAASNVNQYFCKKNVLIIIINLITENYYTVPGSQYCTIPGNNPTLP